MRRIAHLSPRYVSRRLALFWHERRHPDHPWLTADATRFLSGWLLPSDAGLELGSGRSTLWLARRIGTLTSVEHNPAWHAVVAAQLSAQALTNVTYLLRECDKRQPEQAAAAMLPVIGGFPDGGLDFVLVDGVARDRCAMAVLPKLRSAGLLVLDNANWYLPSDSSAPDSRRLGDPPPTPAWVEAWATLKNWRRYWTSNGVTDTAFFLKP